MKKKLLLFLLPLFLGLSLFAQEFEISENPLRITNHSIEGVVSPGSNVSLSLDLALEKGYLAYEDKFKVLIPKPLNTQVGKLKIDPVISFYDKFSKKDKTGIKDSAKVQFLIEFSSKAKIKDLEKIEIELEYQACTDEVCLFPTITKYEIKTVATEPSSKLSKVKKTVLTKFNISDWLKTKSLFEIFALIFFGGFLTSLTPCVFPLIPITLSVIGVNKDKEEYLKPFLLSVTYVFGIAVTYAALGFVAAKTGQLFGAFLGHPVVIVVLSLLFLLMGLSLLGLFEVKLPSKISTLIYKVKPKKGFLGAFISGLFAGIVASPCIGPVLVGLLTFVAQSQDHVLGISLLFTFAFGLGFLLIILGTFSQLLSRLPKSGDWLNIGKYIMGIAFIGLSLFYARPLLHMFNTNDVSVNHNENHLWKPYSEEALQLALSENKPVIVDFYADWCAACIEMEARTFSHESIQAVKDKYVWLQFDATKSSPERKALREKYGFLGLPHMEFFDVKGERRMDLVLTGFEKPAPFRERIDKLLLE